MLSKTILFAFAAFGASSVAAAEYKASFTQYGSTDTWGSGNCNTAKTACGFYTSVRALCEHHFVIGTLTYDPTARILSRRIPERIRCRPWSRRWSRLRHMLEADGANRQQR